VLKKIEWFLGPQLFFKNINENVSNAEFNHIMAEMCEYVMCTLKKNWGILLNNLASIAPCIKGISENRPF
jgi:hypothetical protein